MNQSLNEITERRTSWLHGCVSCETVEGWGTRGMIIIFNLLLSHSSFQSSGAVQGPVVQSRVQWSSPGSSGPVQGPVVQSRVQWSSPGSSGPVQGPVVQSRVQWSSPGSSGPVQGPVVQSRVQSCSPVH